MNELVLMSAPEARTLTDRIKVGVEAVWDLVTTAYTERAWAVLGYQSWDDYCTREFGTSRLRLPREERSEVVASLRESGLSIRAIAAATGDSVGTVHESLSPSVQNRTVEPQTVTGTNGKTYTPKPAVRDDEPDIDAEVEQPLPTMPRRKPLPETFWTAVYDLTKQSERVVRLTEDDRFSKNKGQIADAHLADLTRVHIAITGIINQLKG